jgi:hypothetical protein
MIQSSRKTLSEMRIEPAGRFVQHQNFGIVQEGLDGT